MNLQIFAPRFFMVRMALVAPLLCGVGAPAFAQDDEEDDDIDDIDDILAPLEEEESKPKDEATRLGIVQLVPIGGATQELADQVLEGISREFQDQSFVVEDLSVVIDTGPAKKVDLKQGKKAAAAGKKHLKKAKKLLKKLKFGRAQKYFKKALVEFEKAPAALEDLTPVIDTYLGLAEGYARQGQEEESTEAMRTLAALNPEIEIDTDVYPPQFIRTLSKTLKRVMKADRATLIVDASARGADIQIDGREIGTAPLMIRDIPAGRHYVRVYLENGGLYGAILDLEPGQEMTIEPGFVDSSIIGPVERLAGNQFDDRVAALVADAAKEAELTGAIVGVVSKTRATVPTALIYVDTKSKMVRHLDLLEFDGDLLNMAIESLKASEEVQKSIKGKKFSLVDDEPLIENVKIAQEEQLDELALRFEVQLEYKETKSKKKRKSRKKKRRKKKRSRSATTDDEGDDDEDSRAVLSAGSRGNRKTLRDNSGDPLRRSRRSSARTELEAGEESSFWAQPWVWVGAAAGGAAVVGIVGGGALGATYLVLPPTVGQANVVLPE
jgi:hypothetical protein